MPHQNSVKKITLNVAKGPNKTRLGVNKQKVLCS